VAQAQVKLEADEKKRISLLRDAVHDLLERYPSR
jgi:hypothetical protein